MAVRQNCHPRLITESGRDGQAMQFLRSTRWPLQIERKAGEYTGQTDTDQTEGVLGNALDRRTLNRQRDGWGVFWTDDQESST
ncbi:hypothetical protein RRG08_004663 [Elysia crispata]|uniref:Uncharacterized protein n=1 Tax=Elysia crispata TaxID=231223 RepID=A0AAE0ZNU1_9GAST|nr:hypothetical protein RRG08_004663 [Elysia crispata]